MYNKALILQCIRRPTWWPRVGAVLLAKLLGRGSVCVRADGVELEAGTSEGQGLWCALSGLRYESELPVWLGLLRRGDVVIDVGANIGAYAIRAARAVGPGGRVVAFEPHPVSVERLRGNLTRNAIRNVTLIEAAACDREGHATLCEGGRQSSATMSGRGIGPGLVVRTTSVDATVEALGLARVDWVKMDIEGAEPIAVEGMRRTIARFRPRILFENGVSGRTTIALLRGLGYRVAACGPHGGWRDSESGPNLFAVPESSPRGGASGP